MSSTLILPQSAAGNQGKLSFIAVIIRKLKQQFRLVLLFVVMLITGCHHKNDITTAEGFEIADPFDMELIVSEPLISDPVDMEIDEYGRLYVVEMHGYPLDKSGTGVIRQVMDTDRDGRFDKSIVFADDLILPNSIMRWKNGFIITDAPHVLYFEDTDNDGRADKRDTLLTGFALTNPQHNMNSPLLGIDNWIYIANEGAVSTETYKEEFGDAGRPIRFPGHPDAPTLETNAGGRSVRFQPDKFKLEMTSGHSQFGHTFDAYGHHFEVGNANHIYQEVIREEYLQRNPGLLISNASESLSDHGDAAEVFPITENPQHQLLTDLGVITSACGLHAYLGGVFPAPYDQAVFVAEPVSNLVHVDKLTPHQSIFRATRIENHKEFLASKDPKFRPVNIYTGPDGALYIVDYYRQIIEHPEWMGDDVVRSGQLYNDSDKGRIYRIMPKGGASAKWIRGLQLGSASTDSLVACLGSSNIWWRMNAQRLLIDRKDSSALPLLSGLLTGSPEPMARLHALWTLDALGGLDGQLIRTALRDHNEGVRENALRVGAQYLREDPSIAGAMMALRNDPDAKVRVQLLCVLAGISNVDANETVDQLLLGGMDDRWMQIAALTSARDRMPQLLSLVIKHSEETGKPYSDIVRNLCAMMARSNEAEAMHRLVGLMRSKPASQWIGAALDGLATGADGNTLIISPADQEYLISMCFNQATSKYTATVVRLLQHTHMSTGMISRTAKRVQSTLADATSVEALRSAVVNLLALEDPAKHLTRLQQLITPKELISVQLAAIRTMDHIEGTISTTFFISRWQSLTPELRDATVATMLDDDDRIALLLDAIEKKSISTADIAWPRKVGLMAQWNIPLRDKARALFTSDTEKTTTGAYAESLTIKGDALNGQTLFATQCALCHQMRGKYGIALGPDLGTVHNWSKEAILSNILDPNKSIASGFELWSVEMNSGVSHQGIIASETPGAISLRNVNGWQKTISRSDVRSIRALGLSVMPDDLSRKLDPKAMADLLAYLKKNK